MMFHLAMVVFSLPQALDPSVLAPQSGTTTTTPIQKSVMSPDIAKQPLPDSIQKGQEASIPDIGSSPVTPLPISPSSSPGSLDINQPQANPASQSFPGSTPQSILPASPISPPIGIPPAPSK